MGQTVMTTWLTLEEIAKRLHLSIETVRRMIRRHTLRASKVGKRWLVREEDLEAYLEARPRNVNREEDA